MSAPTEPRNPFYLLLLGVSLLFVMTALAYAFVPTLEGMAFDAGHDIGHNVLHDALVNDGWLWLLGEVVAMLVLALVSMGYDRLRSLQKERATTTIPPTKPEEPPSH